MNGGVEDRVFGEVKRLCYAGLDATTLRVRAVEALRRAVPFEAYCCFTTDPLSGLPMDTVAEGQTEGEGRFFLENIYFEDEVNRFEHIAQGGRRVALLSEATGGRPERALRYREHMRPKGLEHELRSVFGVGETFWGGLELSRERGRPDFDAREVALVERLAPHLGAGLRFAALRAHAPGGEVGVATGLSEPNATSTSNVPGVLTFDRRGRLAGRSRAAERFLRELGEPGAGWEGDGLPAAVWAVVARLRRALKTGAAAASELVPEMWVCTPSGRWIRLQADLTEPGPNGASEVVVIIEPAGPKEMAWLRTTAYGLSPREREIVELVVRGFSTKEISQTLFISEYTVQDHLKSVFEKVGVRGRRALVKHLYLDAVHG